MKLADFSRKGGRARSSAKTAANREKMAVFWRKVRAGELPPPRRHRKAPAQIQALARRYIWWLPAEEALALPRRLVAQVMNLGTLADCALVEDFFGRSEMRRAIKFAEAGWFRERSWTYWHYRLGLTRWGEEPPPPPVRSFDV